MTKAVSLQIGFLFLIAMCAQAPAQSAATDMAVNQAIEDQANTIVLRQKIAEARSAAARDDLPAAAKLYEDAYTLTQQIGSGIEAETTQAISGLVAVRMELAGRAQKNGDYLEADAQVTRVLKVDPHNPDALAFKKNNDDILVSMKGKMPDAATLEKIPLVNADKSDASTHVQNGKLLYEMGKYEDAEVQLNEALKLDPDNQAAFYYLNLVKQAFYAREEQKRITDQQERMVQVEKQWSPKVGTELPVPNPYVTNMDVHTGVGREMIYSKLDHIRVDSISWEDGRPLDQVIRYLSDQSKIRDPDKKGVNFLFNPNTEAGSDAEAAGAGPAPISSQTGLPVTSSGGAGGETVDPSTINIKLTLNDVSLHDALDAIVLVADHRIRYSVEDWGVIFSTKPSGPEPPQLEMRVFKVDPNTFYQGLQGVTAFNFGSANNSSSGSGGSSGSSGGSSGGSGGSGGSSISGAIVPVVDIAGSGAYSTGGGGGGGGGRSGGGGAGGAGGAVGGGAGGGGAGPLGGSGVSFLTTPGYMQSVSVAAQTFFKTLGVDLTTTGRSVFFNDRLGLLFVKATPGELDTVERAIQALNQIAPEVHVKARFIEVSQDDNTSLGFDWYLGNFINGSVVANGGSAPSLNVPNSPNTGAFPGETAANLIGGSASDQLLTGGLRNSGPAIATVTGILTDPNFRVVLHALEQRSGVETLAEPEVVTTSGRQTQMRATDIQYILTGFDFEQGNNGVSTGGTTTGGTP